MIYKKNSEPSLDGKLFKNPTSEYRGTPFWAWNSYLTADELCRQIDVFKQMGLGGFHMHVRTGLENDYLSDEYMALIRTCVNKAKDEKMLAWLYDEDRWPSGAAGGIVTKDIKYRARHLVFTPFNKEDEKGELLSCYDIELDNDGFLVSYKLIDKDEEAKGDKWFAFLRINEPTSWFNDLTYVDTLNKEAIERFVEVTHERYKETVGDEFDKTIHAIFCDEPQFSRKEVLDNSFDKMEISLPWTGKVPQLYNELYGEDIFAVLPELIWDLPNGKISVSRYHYHDMISELFTRAFADTIGSWCEKNNIALTGHMMEEPSLHSQTAALGEAMRSYRGFQLPGIDMLCNNHEFTTAKQAQSATHQYGREGVLSELYGVTGWECDFRTYKHQGDWQAALGITVRVPHLSWYSMKGEAKRDYPASIHYQSPWYKEFPVIENHFARVNTALTRGKPIVKVGVIHPVESYWLHWGPNDKSAILRDSLDEHFDNITKWLLLGSMDFDFISESLLPSQCKSGSAPLKVGKMEYDVIIVPGCETLRTSTYKLLNGFANDGGKLIIMGNTPTLCDAVSSDEGKKLSEKATNIDFSRASLLNCLEENRVITIRYSDGGLTDNYIYQMRSDNDCRWLFIANAYEPDNKDLDRGEEIQIILNGEYAPYKYDTQSGEIYPVFAEYRNGKTTIREKIYGYDSLLFKLTDGRSEIPAEKQSKKELKPLSENLFDYELTEPNVLLLDQAEYKLDTDSEFKSAEEILRLDNECRRRLGMPERGGQIVQPYITGDVPAERTLTLKFTFKSGINIKGAKLALEDADKVKIVLNGENVFDIVEGWFTDRAIGTVKLPEIIKGENILEVTIPFGLSTYTENMFILGNFGVRAIGRKAEIIPLPEKLAFGDITCQGFPFYGGNIKYKFRAASTGGRLTVRSPYYRGALIGVFVDGKREGNIIYPPYELEINGLSDGEHKIELELFTNRANCFGPVHMANEKCHWKGPNTWRTEDDEWTYEYVLQKTGILSAPCIG